MKKLLTALAVLVLALPCWAIDIPAKYRVSNKSPGYCSWASLETLGRTHDIPELFDLVEKRAKDSDEIVDGQVLPKNLGYDKAVWSKLSSMGVRFWMQNTGNFDRTLLKYANSHGCVVGVRSGALGSWAHAIVITHYDDTKVHYYDSNYPDSMWEATREWFDYWWTGMVIVVEKKK